MNENIILTVGARPNFMKIAPLIRELININISYKLIHTGQHYDKSMSDYFFKDLKIPNPDINLNVGSDSQAAQIAKIMIKFEKVLFTEKAKLVVVVGDVNSTLACALVAKKMNIKVAHVEAGLRSFDQTMSEEINRILTDHLSDLLFTTEKSALINLNHEGISKEKIFDVGNIMIDNLIQYQEKAIEKNTYKKFCLQKSNYVLLTLHRPSNIDAFKDFLRIIDLISYLKEKIKIIFPVHPRTKKKITEFNLDSKLNENNVLMTNPLSYLEFLNLMINSKFILTDSGGIQEEASYLGIPVLTLRKNTERPVTIEKGTNTLIGNDPNLFKQKVEEIMNDNYKKASKIENWDGKTSKRIVDIIKATK